MVLIENLSTDKNFNLVFRGFVLFYKQIEI